MLHRHKEFHEASRVVNAAKVWELDPAQYDILEQAAEVVRQEIRSVKYQRQPSRKVQDVDPKGGL